MPENKKRKNSVAVLPTHLKIGFMLERDVEEYLKSRVEKLGGKCLKWVCPGETGVPDRVVMIPGGQIYLVELKKPTGRLSARQKLFKKEAAAMKIPVWTLWDKSEVDYFITKILNLNEYPLFS